jgi:hypothetical protein
LSGLVYIGQGTEYGRLALNVQGTADNPNSLIYSIAYDSSGQLGLGASSSSIGITLRPAETEINNARIASSGLLIDNGTIGKSGSNPKAIMIENTQTIIQNADLSGTVYIGNGDISGALQIVSGAGQATLQVNTDTSGQLTLGSSTANPNAIVITDTSTIIQNMTLTAVSVTGTIESSGGVVSSGAIASSLPTTTRGSGIITITIDSPYNAFNYGWDISGSAKQYSVFLVSINAIIQTVNTDSQCSLSVNGISKWFTFTPINTPLGNITNAVPISTTFIVNRTSDIITIAGSSNYCQFVNVTSTFESTDKVTTIEIIGLA